MVTEPNTQPVMIVFLPSGVGLMFMNVVILVDDANLLIFRYKSRSNVVGHSIPTEVPF